MSEQNQNQEKLNQQDQQRQQFAAMFQRMNQLSFIGGVIRSLDKKDILQTFSKQLGPVLYCTDPYTSNALSSRILDMILDYSEKPEFFINAQTLLLNAVNLTNSVKSNLMMGGMNMNPAMMGMGGMNMMGMGMNPMMGMNMNPAMMGMGGMNMMGMGMNPMMGMNGMQQQTADKNNDDPVEKAKLYIKTWIYQADPIIYLTLLLNEGATDIDFNEDKVFEDILVNALYNSICNISSRNPLVFNHILWISQSLYQTDYYNKMAKASKDNNANGFQQMNMMGMNPMMMNMGGMNMMGGMGMMPGMCGMPGTMNGMMSGFDMNMMNPAMMGMGGMNMMGMNPMMGMNMGGMNMMGGMGMMPGMTGTTAMPGMNNGNLV